MYFLTSELNRGAPDELVSLSWLVWTRWEDRKVSDNYVKLYMRPWIWLKWRGRHWQVRSANPATLPAFTGPFFVWGVRSDLFHGRKGREDCPASPGDSWYRPTLPVNPPHHPTKRGKPYSHLWDYRYRPILQVNSPHHPIQEKVGRTVTLFSPLGLLKQSYSASELPSPSHTREGWENGNSILTFGTPDTILLCQWTPLTIPFKRRLGNAILTFGTPDTILFCQWTPLTIPFKRENALTN